MRVECGELEMGPGVVLERNSLVASRGDGGRSETVTTSSKLKRKRGDLEEIDLRPDKIPLFQISRGKSKIGKAHF